MNELAALLDSNVVIAAVLAEHQHHAASAALFAAAPLPAFAVAAHSVAEAYATLIRPRPRGYGVRPQEAIRALEAIRGATALLGLSPAQTFDAVRAYAGDGGTGPRLYDQLIGEVALTHGIPAIVTWNLRHLTGLFRSLAVQTPAQFLAAQLPTAQRPTAQLPTAQ